MAGGWAGRKVVNRTEGHLQPFPFTHSHTHIMGTILFRYCSSLHGRLRGEGGGTEDSGGGRGDGRLRGEGGGTEDSGGREGGRKTQGGGRGDGRLRGEGGGTEDSGGREGGRKTQGGGRGDVVLKHEQQHSDNCCVCICQNIGNR